MHQKTAMEKSNYPTRGFWTTGFQKGKGVLKQAWIYKVPGTGNAFFLPWCLHFDSWEDKALYEASPCPGLLLTPIFITTHILSVTLCNNPGNCTFPLLSAECSEGQIGWKWDRGVVSQLAQNLTQSSAEGEIGPIVRCPPNDKFHLWITMTDPRHTE